MAGASGVGEGIIEVGGGEGKWEGGRRGRCTDVDCISNTSSRPANANAKRNKSKK